MRVSVAKSLGTCFGVQDAIDLALDPSFQDNLTIVGQLVHNPQTVEKLRQKGINTVDQLDSGIKTKNVMITAHGAPASRRQQAEAMGFRVIDATCPLVLRVHKAIASFVRRGFHPVVVGQVDHVEVRGILGDLEEYTVILDESDVHRLEGKKQIGVVSQTTQQIHFVLKLVEKIRQTFPEARVEFVDTVCQPTKDRQFAVRGLAHEVDIMIVIGGHNSSNTKKLLRVCDELGVEAYHIERKDELRPEMFEGKEHVGITAGTSTPREVIEEVYEAIIRIPEVDQALCSGMPPKEKYLK